MHPSVLPEGHFFHKNILYWGTKITSAQNVVDELWLFNAMDLCLCYVKVKIQNHTCWTSTKSKYRHKQVSYIINALNICFQSAVNAGNFLFGWIYDEVIS